MYRRQGSTDIKWNSPLHEMHQGQIFFGGLQGVHTPLSFVASLCGYCTLLLLYTDLILK